MNSNDTGFDWIPDLAAFVRQRWTTVAVVTAGVLVLATGYLAVATPKFTATATVLIDTQAAAPFQQQTSIADSQFANGIVESQVEVIQSAGVAVDVLRKLGLTYDKSFLANAHSLSGSIIAPIKRLFATPMTPTLEDDETAAAELLTSMIDVKRIGMSYVLDLSVRSVDPIMSARLANAVVDAYVEAGLNGKSENTKRASDWLEQRISQLHEQAITADQAVQTFKSAANIVDTDRGLMNERHLGELNSQLVLARAHTAEARGRYDQTQSILRNGLFTGDVSDALQNLVIIHLREQYVDAARQAAGWEAKLGPDHVAVTTMKKRMKDIETQIQSEVQRIANGYRSDYEIATKSQEDIELQLGSLVSDADVTNKNLVRLRALQSSADTYRSLYQNFLQRYTQAVQDQSFPISMAQMVAPARTPLRKSHPKGTIILGAAAMVGLALGFAVAFCREAMANSSTSIRKTAQIADSLGLPSLGMLPVLKVRHSVGATGIPGSAALRLIGYVPDILRQTFLVPHSAFAETIRGLRLRMTQTKTGPSNVRVVACVSAEVGEGKSTVCANFAFSLAQNGFRTLLIDGDFHKQSLSCLLAPGRVSGFTAAASHSVSIEKAVWHDPQTSLDFLPADPGAHQADFGSLRASELFARLRESYEYIIVDMPAVSADAWSAASVTDGYLLVVEWGATPVSLIREMMTELRDGHFLGAVLNKVNFAKLARSPAPYGGPVVSTERLRAQSAT